MSIFTGAGVAIVTPFHADGSVNYEKLDELIQFHCDNGTDSIIISRYYRGILNFDKKKNIWTALSLQSRD